MKNMLTNNWGLKILSVVIAVLLWVTIINIDDPVVTATFHNIPVQIKNEEVVTSRGYQYNIESGEKVDVKVKGKRSIVDNLTDADFIATADFNSFNNMYMAAITVECTSHSGDDIIVSSNTETMAVKLEESDTQPFSIRIVRNGTVKEGYYLYNATASTGLIQVTGSRTQISNIREVVVEVDVEGKMNSFSVDATPLAYDMEGNQIDAKKIVFDQDNIEVNVGICPTKMVDITVMEKGKPAYGYYLEKLEFAPSGVLIAAPEDELDNLDEIVIMCDISGVSSDVEQQIILEEYIKEKYGDVFIPVDENTAVGIKATIGKMSSKEIEISQQDINIRNLENDLKCYLYAVGGIRVNVMGRENDLQDIVGSDLLLYVDVKGCSAGTYSRALLTAYKGDLLIKTDPIMVRLSNSTPDEDPDEMRQNI